MKRVHLHIHSLRLERLTRTQSEALARGLSAELQRQLSSANVIARLSSGTPDALFRGGVVRITRAADPVQTGTNIASGIARRMLT
jgi:hypothetical protein